jgi:uncharacterized membrane protein YesL
MSFFKKDYSKPGPGVRKDEPRKKGIKRFFEILTTDFGDLLKLNLLFLFCALPSLVMFVLGLFGYLFLILVPLSILAAYPIGGAFVASLFIITKMLRDDPGFVFEDFKTKFKENHKQAAIPGILCTLFIYAQLVFWGPLELDDVNLYGFLVIIAIFTLFLFLAITPYIFIQMAYMELKFYPILKNSILLFVDKFTRSLLGMIAGFGPWLLIILYYPASLVIAPLILLYGFTIPWLMCLMFIWQHINEQFEIEEGINKIRKTEDLVHEKSKNCN